MDWQAPSFVEIHMDAELTSYVTEDDDAPIAREE